MKYKTFLSLLTTYKKVEENSSKWYEFGIDLHEGKYPIAPYLHEIMKAGFETTYNEEGIDWIDWFIFENEYGCKVWEVIPTVKQNGDIVNPTEQDGFGAHDGDGNPIAYNYKSLWTMLEDEYKIKTKNKK